MNQKIFKIYLTLTILILSLAYTQTWSIGTRLLVKNNELNCEDFKITSDGSCGNNSKLYCTKNLFCSKWGWCGESNLYTKKSDNSKFNHEKIPCKCRVNCDKEEEKEKKDDEKEKEEEKEDKNDCKIYKFTNTS